MIICIASSETTTDGIISPIFGRCPYYIFYDTEKDSYEALSNPSVTMGGGAGIQAAQFVVNKGVKTVISGNIGPNSAGVLQSAGIEMITGITGLVKDAVAKFKSNELHSTGRVTQAGYGMRRGFQQEAPSQKTTISGENLEVIKNDLKELVEKVKELIERMNKLEEK